MAERNGWIKFHKSTLDSPIFDNPKLLKVWIWCLCKAFFEGKEQIVGKQIVHLKKGQFIFGRLSASSELKLNDRTVYDYMKILEKLEMIAIKSNNKFSIVTINNYDSYQGIEPSKKGSKQYGIGYYNGLRDKESDIEKIVEEKIEQIMNKEE
jgi:hypothetical protein